MSKNAKIVMTFGFVLGLVGSFIIFYEATPEIEPLFKDEAFIENLSNYE